MPELPEVETVKNGLKPKVAGLVIDRAEIFRPNLRIPFPDDFCEILNGKKILDLKRRSKYLLFDLEDDLTLIIHLGMSGKLVLHDDEPEEIGKHDHVTIRLSNDSWLVYNDARRFGLMTFSATDDIENHKLFHHLGPEPLEKNFDDKYFIEVLKKRNIPIKQAIMNAELVVGVGNIYASESLFRSKILPTVKASEINKRQAESLRVNIINVLKEAIESGGSTLRDYVKSDGDLGYFQHKFNVYGRENEECLICNTVIKRIVQQGRSTFYCPSCQG